MPIRKHIMRMYHLNREICPCFVFQNCALENHSDIGLQSEWSSPRKKKVISFHNF